jgi:hypothetical protein
MVHSASAPTYVRGPVPPGGGKGFILTARTPVNKVQELQHALQDAVKKHAVEIDALKAEHKHQMGQQIEGYDSLNEVLAQKNQTLREQGEALARHRTTITDLERKLSKAGLASGPVKYDNPNLAAKLAAKRKLDAEAAASEQAAQRQKTSH